MKIQLFFNQYLPMHVSVLKKVKFQLVQTPKTNQMMMVNNQRRFSQITFDFILEPLKKRVKKENSVKKVNLSIRHYNFINKFSLQKSHKSGSISSNSNSRRKTRVMSDEEDITMDETNQVPIKYFYHISTYFLCIILVFIGWHR